MITIDKVAHNLGIFLKNYINKKICDIYKNSSIVAINGILLGDYPFDKNSLPLLKVFRISDTFLYSKSVNTKNTLFSLQYILEYPDYNTLPGVLIIVAEQIIEALKYLEVNKKLQVISPTIAIEYRTILDNPNPITVLSTSVLLTIFCEDFEIK